MSEPELNTSKESFEFSKEKKPRRNRIVAASVWILLIGLFDWAIGFLFCNIGGCLWGVPHIDTGCVEVVSLVPLSILLIALLCLLIKALGTNPTRPQKRRELIYIGLALIVCAGGLIHLSILACQPYMSGWELVYTNVRDYIQDAVTDYAADNYGMYPTMQSTVTIDDYEYKIIDMCSLINPEGGPLYTIPDGVARINGSDNDNCDNGCEGCYEDFYSYIWAVDEEGNVYSTCISEECTANGEDGYQGVWP